MLFDYDDSNIESIFQYAKKLEGMTFRQIEEEYKAYMLQRAKKNSYFDDDSSFSVEETDVSYNISSKSKGGLGNILEKEYFGYNPNGNQKADFSKVDLELKLTCIDAKKSDGYKAGERLSITNISYNDPVIDDFYKSHVWDKIKRILLIHYLRDRAIKDKLNFRIMFVNLFTPPETDLKIIMDDYQKIIQMIKNGDADKISEGMTFYLGACTKGSTAESSKRPQYYGDHRLAKKRNFCFKQKYMNYILQHYVLTDTCPCEEIIKDASELVNTTFEDVVISRINKYYGKTDKELCELFDVPYDNNKAQWITLAYRMLGIKNNRAAEFEKANIVVKSIRIEQSGNIRENMSFPPFKFKQLVQEKWEDSILFRYFDNTKFLFVVYKSNGTCYELIKAQLWNMPFDDLNIEVQNGWKNIQEAIKNGVTFTMEKQKNGIRYTNSLPKKNDNRIIHIRPHAKKAAYRFKDGTIVGDWQSNANELPDGQHMTTQSFWLNNTYVLEQLKLK